MLRGSCKTRMLPARHRIVYVDFYGIKTLDSADKVVVDVRPPKKMKKRRELDALASTKKHATVSSGSARPTDRRSLVAADDSSSSDVFVSAERGPCQLVTSRYWNLVWPYRTLYSVHRGTAKIEVELLRWAWRTGPYPLYTIHYTNTIPNPYPGANPG